MADILPTVRAADWGVTDFLDGAVASLSDFAEATTLRLYFYAVTPAGWGALSGSVRAWCDANRGRTAVAYIGTDHALTDPDALRLMVDAGINVRLLMRYNGVYHPKLIWLIGAPRSIVLAGSNNLTLEGMTSNIEFALRGLIADHDDGLERWHDEIHGASDPLTPELLESYAREREAFGRSRAAAKVAGSFTWSRRSSATPRAADVARRPWGTREVAPPLAVGLNTESGDLIIEVMPLETGTGGSQVQIPMAAARGFFGLPAGRDTQVDVNLRNVQSGVARQLTMTRFENATTRLVIAELQYRDRKCVIHFRRTGDGAYDFEIVREAIDPDRYRGLIGLCSAQTRAGSRHWRIVPA